MNQQQPLFPIPGLPAPPIRQQQQMPLPPSLNQLRNAPGPVNARSNEHWIEAKKTYMDYLRDILTPIVYETVKSIYMDAVTMTQSKQHEDIEKTFMDFLVETRVWSIPIIKGETQNILHHCPDIATILKGVFVSNVMVLSSAQLNRPDAPTGKVRLNIPQCEVFVQSLYANVAARLFNHPNIFRKEGLTSDQIIDNRNLAHEEIRLAIDATVRSLIPFPQVIESSMNFKGNNPIITARPQYQQRQKSLGRIDPVGAARRGQDQRDEKGRVSDRTIIADRNNFQETRRPSQQQTQKQTQQSQSSQQVAVAAQKSSISYKPQPAPKQEKKVPVTVSPVINASHASHVKSNASQVSKASVTKTKEERKSTVIQNNNNDKKSESHKSKNNISETRLKQNEFQQSSSPFEQGKSKISFKPPQAVKPAVVKAAKKVHNVEKDAAKVEKTFTFKSQQPPRHSQFREQTGSNAIKEAVSKLNIDEDSYKNMTSSSKTSSSSSNTSRDTSTDDSESHDLSFESFEEISI